MRELKFRVWNEMLRRMYSYEDLEKNTIDITKIKFIQGVFLPNSEGNKVMQYTGIKDINNKEIYEGDIVEIYPMDLFENTVFKGKVKFCDGSWIVDNEKDCRYLFTEIDENKVIGNIYEDKDLFK